MAACTACDGSSPPLATRALVGAEEHWARAFETGTGSVLLGWELERKITLEEVQAAANSTAAKQPILSARIVHGPGKHSFAYHVCAKSRSVSVRSFDIPVSSTAGLSLFHQVVEADVNTPFGAKDGGVDVFQVHLYPASKSTFLVLRLHSAAIDRCATVVVAQSFLSNLSAAVLQRLDSAPILTSDSVSLPAPLLDLLPTDLKKKGVFARTLNGVGYVANALKLSIMPFEAGKADHRKNKFETAFVRLEFTTSETTEILKCCKVHSTSLFGANCAAFLKAVATSKGLGDKKSEEFGVTSLIECRAHLDPALPFDAIGNYDAGLPLSAKVNESTPFWDIAQSLSTSANESVASRKMFTEMPVLDSLFSTALNNPTLTKESSLRTGLVAAFVDAPQTTTWQDVHNLEILDSIGPFASIHGIGACVAMPETIQNGKLQFLLAFATPLFSRITMIGLQESMKMHFLSAAGLA